MSPTSDDIPSLTLRVLENIQGELVGLRGDVRGLHDQFDGLRGEFRGLHDQFDGLRGEFRGLNDQFGDLRGDVQGLNDRFDRFLGFAGRDVQDLKVRVSALEQLELARRP